MRFVYKSWSWLERQLLIVAAQPRGPQPWFYGTEILFRGQSVRLEKFELDESDWIELGTEKIRIQNGEANLRPAVEHYLKDLATKELTARVQELAAHHGLCVKRITIRNQRSRWGSCSQRGVIALNWRLIQTPEFVRDYIVLHELAHLREMNHSPRFWREVARLCPKFVEAEKWLKAHAALLR